MDNKLRGKFPAWCGDRDKGKFNTTLTDDLDSLIGCSIEYMVKGNPINYYYDFKNLYRMDSTDTRKSIGIDLALTSGKCWDNHVVRIQPSDSINQESANLNSIYNISSRNYTEKYAGSTVLTMWSFYNLPLPETIEGKMLLLCIDGFYIGCFSRLYHQQQKNYLRLLGFDELVDLVNRTERIDYVNMIEKYHLKDKFRIDDNGYICTNISQENITELLNIDIRLPEHKFDKVASLSNHKGNINTCQSVNTLSNTVSFALTSKQDFKYTSIKGNRV